MKKKKWKNLSFKSKNICLIIICFILLTLSSIAYSALNETLTITGDLVLRSIKDIRITSLELVETVNDGYEYYNSKYTNNTVSISASLPKNGSKVTYEVTIKNSGNVDMLISDIQSSTNNNSVSISINDSNSQYKIIHGTTRTFEVTLENTTDEPINEVTGLVELTFDEAEEPVIGQTIVNYVKYLSLEPTAKIRKVGHDEIPADASATGKIIPAVTDYRYYGTDTEGDIVNNYVCLDMEDSETCPDKHLYRIIGVLYDELTNSERVKLIKAINLTDGTTTSFSWNLTTNINDGKYYQNIWAPINYEDGRGSNATTYIGTENTGSSLMYMLNNTWWNGESGKTYKRTNNEVTIEEKIIDFSSDIYKLSETAKSYIAPARYYLGTHNNTEVLIKDMYNYERGIKRYNNDRTLYWDGIVGLMYLSDYGYVSNEQCINNTTLNSYSSCTNWLSGYNEWSLVPFLTNPNHAFLLHTSGSVLNRFAVYTYVVRPVMYLTNNVKINGGSGTSGLPYLLSLN